MPKCKVCGQDEHGMNDGVLDHCKTCRRPVYAGTTYWVHRRVHGYADHFYCDECITWSRSADQAVLRRLDRISRAGLR